MYLVSPEHVANRAASNTEKRTSSESIDEADLSPVSGSSCIPYFSALLGSRPMLGLLQAYQKKKKTYR